MTIISYFAQLTDAAIRREVSLKQAFLDAGMNTSAFYRSRAGASMSLGTAEKVMAAIVSQP